MVKLRDEAHRFSNSYRKQQMKNEIKSEFKKVKIYSQNIYGNHTKH